MKDGQPIRTTISILFKTSSRANAKLKMKVFRNKTIDDVLDPDKKLLGVPATAEIVKMAVGKRGVQDLKNLLEPPKAAKKSSKKKLPISKKK